MSNCNRITFLFLHPMLAIFVPTNPEKWEQRTIISHDDSLCRLLSTKTHLFFNFFRFRPNRDEHIRQNAVEVFADQPLHGVGHRVGDRLVFGFTHHHHSYLQRVSTSFCFYAVLLVFFSEAYRHQLLLPDATCPRIWAQLGRLDGRDSGASLHTIEHGRRKNIKGWTKNIITTGIEPRLSCTTAQKRLTPEICMKTNRKKLTYRKFYRFIFSFYS